MSDKREVLPGKGEYQVRECITIKDFSDCVEMQRIVWEFADLDVTPIRSFIATKKKGGFTYGVFDETGQMIGFSLAMPALDDDNRPYYYSQMMAVLPEFQNAGFGVKLKLAQRDHALKKGIDRITWTFDPLQSRNAHVNIVKLGCVIRQYLVNFYGESSSSVLHRGLETDRLFPEWWVRSARVIDALAGKIRNDKPEAVIEIPSDIEAVKRRDLDEARACQLNVRESFMRYLSEGLMVAGFERDTAGGNSRYLLYRDDIQEGEKAEKI